MPVKEGPEILRRLGDGARFDRDGEDGGSVCRSRNDGHGTVVTRDAMNLFAFALLIERHRPQNRREDHPGTVNPGESLMPTNGFARDPCSFVRWEWPQAATSG